MSKTIILLADGTGNGAAALFKTNVWRLYKALDLSEPPPAGEARQIAYYHDGVGTSTFKPLAILGGVFGVGLKRNIVHMYAFLCRKYEPGDRIYVFGFSRGAFTARVLGERHHHAGHPGMPRPRRNSPATRPTRTAAIGGATSFRSSSTRTIGAGRSEIPRKSKSGSSTACATCAMPSSSSGAATPSTAVRRGARAQSQDQRRLHRRVGHGRGLRPADRRDDARHRRMGLAAVDAELCAVAEGHAGPPCARA